MSAPLYAVVLAGGVGSRFWPLSTPERPKQLLPLITDASMLSETVERLVPLVGRERVLILTSERLLDAILAALPSIGADQLVLEPRPAGTAAALTWAAAQVYAELEPTLRAANAVSFDDLLVLPVRILRANPEVREHLARRFQHVLVDEYQDTNRAQYEFIRLIGGGHGNVCVVGDDDQAIYGWRAAGRSSRRRDRPACRVAGSRCR